MEGSFTEAVAPHDIESPYIQLATLMTNELGILPPMSPLRCIFRVPDRLRRIHEKDVHYTPKLISIGPLHHGKSALKAMEEHKNRYLQCFMSRTHLSLMDYIRKIKDQEAKLRSRYSETIQFESDKFVRIILVDAIFVIEFLVRLYGHPELLDENDCIFGKPQMANDIWPDLLMLENQLPFFILEELFDPDIFSVPNERLSLLHLSCMLLNVGPTFMGMLDNWETSWEINNSSQGEVYHFVDLLRKLCIAPILEKERCEGRQFEGRYTATTAPSIEELHVAGVKFKVRSTNNLFDIRFKDGILEIPNLKTEDTTELILRNLVAFEQCSTFGARNTSDFGVRNTSDFGVRYISDYVSIMDQFVNTPEDVELLVKYRIVENYLGGGSNGLSTMINSLSTGIIYDSMNFSYGNLCGQLNKFCNVKWNRWKANLKQKYFAVGFFILILTVVQTFCSIIALFWR